MTEYMYSVRGRESGFFQSSFRELIKKISRSQLLKVPFSLLLTGYGKEVFNLPIWLRNGLSLEWHNTGDNVLITLNFLLFKLRQDEAKLLVAELKGKKIINLKNYATSMGDSTNFHPEKLSTD